MSIKDDLYSILNDYGKETLQLELQNNINSSIPNIKEILFKTIERNHKNKYSNNNNQYDDSEKPLSLLCEAFLHFLLTVTSLPSQRKVMFRDIEIDLVIPDLKHLQKDPNKNLIIKFDRGISLDNYINRLHNTISIKKENIWIVSVTPLNIDYRNYVIYKNQNDEKNHHLFIGNNNIDETYKRKEKGNLVLNSHSIHNINSNIIPFFNIVVDINKFLQDINHTGLKLVT
jgi:hypothetical protein